MWGLQRLYSKSVRCHFILIGLGLLWLIGCGETINLKPEGGPDVAQVIGTVTFQGKPLPNAAVQFHPQGAGDPATGTTEENGRFALSTYGKKDGAVLGFHAVTIQVFPEGVMVPGFEEEYQKKSPIPQAYWSPETTPLMVEVKDSGNNFPLVIK